MKLECYVVIDLLPIYVDELTSIETANDINIHLKTCNACKSEYIKLKNTDIIQASEKVKNLDEVKYLRKYNKNYSLLKKFSIGLGIFCIILFLGFFATLVTAYKLQYNDHAVSNYLNITINPEKGSEYMGVLEDYQIYTYQLDEAYFIDFNAQHLDLKDALKNSSISLNDMIRNLDKTHDNDNVQVYEFENYQIIITDEFCIISPISVSYNDIINAIDISD